MSNDTPAVIDSSVVIDGRIKSIIISGFLSRQLVLTNLVDAEVAKFCADARSSKAARIAQQTWNYLGNLKQALYVEISSDQQSVDAALVDLAEEKSWAVFSLDNKLIESAQEKGLKTLQLNRLLQVLKTPLLPGDLICLHLQQAGRRPRQALGYLDDGSLVIVEAANHRIGEMVKTKIIRYLQSNYGKIYIAKLIS